MAQALNGTTQYFTVPAPFHGASAMTAGIWVNYTSLATEKKAFALWDDAGGVGLEWLITTSGTALLVAVEIGSAQVATGGSLSTGVWTHVAVRYTGAAVQAFINGAQVASTACSGSISTTTDQVSIGAGLNGASPSAPVNGSIAEAGLWNASLTDGEMVSLAKAVSPLLIRPQSLRLYMDGIRNVFDWKGATITPVASPTVADHPRVYLR